MTFEIQPLGARSRVMVCLIAVLSAWAPAAFADCNCPMDYEPTVCGKETFSNPCFASCAGYRVYDEPLFSEDFGTMTWSSNQGHFDSDFIWKATGALASVCEMRNLASADSAHWAWPGLQDPSGGHFLAVNGCLNADTRLWCRNFRLPPGTLEMSVQAASLVGVSAVEFAVDGQAPSRVVSDPNPLTPPNPIPTPPEWWTPFVAEHDFPAATGAEICVMQASSGFDGNDYGDRRRRADAARRVYNHRPLNQHFREPSLAARLYS